MAGKRVWMSWLGQGAPQPVVAAMSQVGLEVSGAPWADDLEKAGWSELSGLLTGDDAPDLFVAAGSRADFASPRIAYGLSLVMMRLAAAGRRTPYPVALFLDGPPDAGRPTLHNLFHDLDGAAAGWNAKLVAAGFKAFAPPASDYHLDVIGHQAIGQWVEVGPPAEAHWAGAMLGVTGEGAEIEHHAVGERGQLPERTVLNYASQGIEAELGGEAYRLWSVQNDIGPEHSYFVKITGFPKAIVFGGHPGREDAEVHVLRLS